MVIAIIIISSFFSAILDYQNSDAKTQIQHFSSE